MNRTMLGQPKRFACPSCHRTFTTNESKKNHEILVHEKAGRFKCGLCDRSFTIASKFAIHERTHTGEKPFRCNICQQQFNTSGALASHHIYRHAEKKFICEVCGKGWGSRSAAKKHLVVHSTEKPFKCELCPDRKFVCMKYLNAHHRNLHANKPLGCGLNGKSENPESDYEDSDDDSREPEKATRSGDVIDEQNGNRADNESLAKRATAESWIPDGAVRGFEGPIKRRTERDSDGQTANGAHMSAYRPPDASSTIAFSPDKSESSSVRSANLKLVFGVEYRAPD